AHPALHSFLHDALPIFESASLAAVCDIDPKKLQSAATKWPQAKRFDRPDELLKSGTIDAVLVATPHYSHPDITIAAFDHNLHVRSEEHTSELQSLAYLV